MCGRAAYASTELSQVTASVLDKRDLLRLWNQAGKLQCGSGLDGCFDECQPSNPQERESTYRGNGCMSVECS